VVVAEADTSLRVAEATGTTTAVVLSTGVGWVQTGELLGADAARKLGVACTPRAIARLEFDITPEISRELACESKVRMSC
jgi:hypothetical protein